MSEVSTTQETQVPAAAMAAWGSSSNLGASDFRLSSILLMQGSSDMVKDMDHEAKIGEMRDNITGELIGTIKDPVEFIPFHLEKRWDVEFNDNGKWKWFSSDLFDSSNSTRPISRNKTTKRIVEGDKCYFIMFRAFVLLKKDLDRGVTKPYIIDFKNSSREAGRQVGQAMFNDNRLEKLSPAAYTFTLGAEEISTDDHSWLAYTTRKTERTTPEEESTAFKMYELVQKMDTSGAEEKRPEPKGVDDNLEF